MSDEQGLNREVGYCKPPVEHRFKPGESGNPNGRPVGSVSLRSLLEDKLTEVAAGDERRTYGQVLVDETFRLAVRGNTAALRLVWEYAEGKPLQCSVLTEDKPRERDYVADAVLFDREARELMDELLARVCSDESKAIVGRALANAARNGCLPWPHETYDPNWYGDLEPA